MFRTFSMSRDCAWLGQNSACEWGRCSFYSSVATGTSKLRSNGAWGRVRVGYFEDEVQLSRRGSTARCEVATSLCTVIGTSKVRSSWRRCSLEMRCSWSRDVRSARVWSEEGIVITIMETYLAAACTMAKRAKGRTGSLADPRCRPLNSLVLDLG